MQSIDTIVVGGGQAGLASSLHLARRGVDHVVLEAGRIGESWRSRRWDSLPSGAGSERWSVWTSPVPSVARTSRLCAPGVAAHGSVHWTQVAFEIGRLIRAACQAPSSTRTSTAVIPRSGAQATPPISTAPGDTVAPLVGTSIRDCVRIGASLAQPRGTQ